MVNVPIYFISKPLQGPENKVWWILGSDLRKGRAFRFVLELFSSLLLAEVNPTTTNTAASTNRKNLGVNFILLTRSKRRRVHLTLRSLGFRARHLNLRTRGRRSDLKWNQWHHHSLETMSSTWSFVWHWTWPSHQHWDRIIFPLFSLYMYFLYFWCRRVHAESASRSLTDGYCGRWPGCWPRGWSAETRFCWYTRIFLISKIYSSGAASAAVSKTASGCSRGAKHVSSWKTWNFGSSPKIKSKVRFLLC